MHKSKHFGYEAQNIWQFDKAEPLPSWSLWNKLEFGLETSCNPKRHDARA